MIEKTSYPRLPLPYNQMKHKLAKHGHLHGLTVGINGKSPKSEASIMMESLTNMDNNNDTRWYLNAKYQSNTERVYDTINLVDEKTNTIVIYEKLPDGSHVFLTTCELTKMEKKYLDNNNGQFIIANTLKKNQK